MNSITANRIASIIQELTGVAERAETQSAEYYLDKAQQLATLWLGITEDIIQAEMSYKREIADRIEAGETVSKAKLMVESRSENYKVYCYLLKKDKQVLNIMQIAKKRCDLERFVK